MPSKAFEGSHIKRGGGNELEWKVSVVSAVEDQLACRCFAHVGDTCKCSLHDLIPLINLSHHPPGFGNLLTPADHVHPWGP